jgi:dTDP-4-dehydrorhamnose reductase
MSEKAGKWLVFGASGMLGAALSARLAARGQDVVGVVNQHPLDLPGVPELRVDVKAIGQVLEICREVKPQVIVNAAALTNVDYCEDHHAEAALLNGDLAGWVARGATEVGAKMVHISTDQLWDGGASLIDEAVMPTPINMYGETKYRGERLVHREAADALIVRTNFFGPGRPWRPSFSDWVRQALSAGKGITGFADCYFTPIDLGTLCDWVIACVDQDIAGVLHIAGDERISKYDFILRLADVFELDRSLVTKGLMADVPLMANRPKDMSLDCTKVQKLLRRTLPDVDMAIRNVAP